jgi:hypothetical protein
MKIPKTSLVTISFDLDLEYLKYSIQSVRRFCKQYYDYVIILDDHHNDCEKCMSYLDSIGQPFHVNSEAKYIKHGYVRQQYMKFTCTRYIQDTEYVCFVDSDSIFTKDHTPSIYYDSNNKPYMLHANYEKFVESCKQHPDQPDPVSILEWQRLTSNALGIQAKNEYMQLMPLLYSPTLIKQTVDHMEKIHKCSLIEYLSSKPTISEFNILGAYAHHVQPESYHWLDRWDPEQSVFYIQQIRDIFIQGSRKNTPQHVDLSDPNNKFNTILN